LCPIGDKERQSFCHYIAEIFDELVAQVILKGLEILGCLNIFTFDVHFEFSNPKPVTDLTLHRQPICRRP
jgi:hypothetical protein